MALSSRLFTSSSSHLYITRAVLTLVQTRAVVPGPNTIGISCKTATLLSFGGLNATTCWIAIPFAVHTLCTYMDADKRSDSPKVLQILDPLKEADSDTSSVGVDIRENNDAAISQNLVSLQHFQGSQLLPGLSANVHVAVQTHWLLP